MSRKSPLFVTVPAIIEKADIAVYAQLMNHTNSKAVAADGVVYEPSELRFDTFAGALNTSDGRYHGEYLFEPGEWTDLPPGDFSTLPNLEP